jgi:hypothetical protein
MFTTNGDFEESVLSIMTFFCLQLFESRPALSYRFNSNLWDN